MSNLRELLLASTQEMIYISESDYPVEVVWWTQERVRGSETLEALLCAEAGLEADSPVEEIAFEAFFAPLVAEQEWFGEQEKADRARYSTLRDLLLSHLMGLRCLRFGEVEKTIFVVGWTQEGELCGVRTEAVET